MADFVKEKIVKANRAHECFGCTKAIAVGEHYTANVSTDMGKIFTTAFCIVCDAVIREFYNPDDFENMGRGDLADDHQYFDDDGVLLETAP